MSREPVFPACVGSSPCDPQLRCSRGAALGGRCGSPALFLVHACCHQGPASRPYTLDSPALSACGWRILPLTPHCGSAQEAQRQCADRLAAGGDVELAAEALLRCGARPEAASALQRSSLPGAAALARRLLGGAAAAEGGSQAVARVSSSSSSAQSHLPSHTPLVMHVRAEAFL